MAILFRYFWKNDPESMVLQQALLTFLNII